MESTEERFLDMESTEERFLDHVVTLVAAYRSAGFDGSSEEVVEVAGNDLSKIMDAANAAWRGGEDVKGRDGDRS